MSGAWWWPTIRFGLYPHYYLHAHGRLIVAPEVKAILEDPAVRPEIDRVALAEYVRFQFLLGDKTFFQGIKLLPAATLLRYDAGDDTLHTREYWDMASIPERAPDFDEAAEEAGRLLQRGPCASAPAGRGGWACSSVAGWMRGPCWACWSRNVAAGCPR